MQAFLKLIFIIVFSSVSFAQVIDKMEISGNKNFSASDYVEWVKVSRGSKVFPALVNYIL
jgi:hypothetical protein